MNWASYTLVALLVINILSTAHEAGKTGRPRIFWIALIAGAINAVLYYFAGVLG